MPELNLRNISMAVLGALAGALVTAAVVLLARGDGNAPILIVTPGPEATAASPLQSPTAEAELKVHIKGAVHNPGVYALRPGDRLEDALTAAGGGTADADLDALNLAVEVMDGASYNVPKIGETPRPEVKTASAITPPAQSSGIPAQPGSGLIDLNTASVALLETLDGIGPVRAQAMVDFRQQNGCFQSTSDVTKVAGIGSGICEKIRDFVTVNGCP